MNIWLTRPSVLMKISNFFGQMYGVEHLEHRATTLLTEVGLQRFIHEPLHIFSRGMTQRFMIARALLHRPSVLLLDEPFSGLDASAQQFVLERIAKERQKGTGVVVTTHNTALGYLVGTPVSLYDKWRVGRDRAER